MYRKRSFLSQKWSPLAQNRRDALKAPVHPRIYLGLRYEHLTPSASRDMGNVQKTQFLPQKCSPLSQNGRNPKKASVYSRIYLGLKYEHWATSGSRDMTNIPKTSFFAPKLNWGDFFLLRAYCILNTCIVLKYQVPTPNSN